VRDQLGEHTEPLDVLKLLHADDLPATDVSNLPGRTRDFETRRTVAQAVLDATAHFLALYGQQDWPVNRNTVLGPEPHEAIVERRPPLELSSKRKNLGRQIAGVVEILVEEIQLARNVTTQTSSPPCFDYFPGFHDDLSATHK